MQVSSLHEDVVVCRSMMWQVTCTLVHHGEETFVVDSPVFQDELDALPALLGQAGWSLSGLLATHGDWDHVMARYAFPDAALGVAETTAARLRAEPGDAQRVDPGVRRGELRRAPAAAVARAGPGAARAGPAGDRRARARAHPGRRPHARRDGDLGAVGARAARRRLPAPGRDPVAAGAGQPQRLPGDARPAQAATSSRPTGSSPGTARRSTPPARWRSCARTSPTSQALPAQDAPLPLARRSARQRRIHADNVEKVGAGAARDPARGPRDAPASTSRASWGSGRCSASSASTRRATCGDRSAWVQRAGTQVHLLFADEPGRRRRAGHVAVVAERLRRDGRAPGGRRLRGRAARAALGRRARLRAHARPATASSSWPPRRSPDLDAPVAGARLEDRLGVGRRPLLDGPVLSANRLACHGHSTQPSTRRPSCSGPPRWAQRSARACRRPSRAGEHDLDPRDGRAGELALAHVASAAASVQSSTAGCQVLRSTPTPSA